MHLFISCAMTGCRIIWDEQKLWHPCTRPALCVRECERDEGMVKLVPDIQGSDPMAASLLIECRGRTPEALEVRLPCSCFGFPRLHFSPAGACASPFLLCFPLVACMCNGLEDGGQEACLAMGRTAAMSSVRRREQPHGCSGLTGGPGARAQERICEVRQALLKAKLPFGAKAAQPMPLDAYEFKRDKADYNVYWDVRKGLIPIVGAARETGAARARARAGRAVAWRPGRW